MMQTFSQGCRVLPLMVDGEERYAVIVDRSTGLENPVVVFTADSICLEIRNGASADRRYTKMGDVNGINAAANKYGFVAIHLIPKRRLVGLISGWNTRGGMLPFDPTYDDMNYVKAVVQAVDNIYGETRKIFVGFSAGAQFGHIVVRALSLYHVFSALVSISGTVLGTEPLTPPQTSLVVFHGSEDQKLPFEGGYPKDWKARFIMRMLLAEYAGKSNPSLQAKHFAWLNNFGTDPWKETATSVGVRRQYHPEGSPIVVVEYRAVTPWGGHTYHGRDNFESLVSRSNGQPAPRRLYPINDLWAQELGLSVRRC